MNVGQLSILSLITPYVDKSVFALFFFLPFCRLIPFLVGSPDALLDSLPPFTAIDSQSLPTLVANVIRPQVPFTCVTEAK